MGHPGRTVPEGPGYVKDFAARVLRAPPSGHPTKQVLYQEARHDDQVPNHATRIIVRELGLPLLTPRNESVYGVEEKAGPLDSAYVQWDTMPPTIPPKTNKPADPLERPDSAHYAVRELESCLLQLERFFKPDGKVEHTCTGPCTNDNAVTP